MQNTFCFFFFLHFHKLWGRNNISDSIKTKFRTFYVYLSTRDYVSSFVQHLALSCYVFEKASKNSWKTELISLFW